MDDARNGSQIEPTRAAAMRAASRRWCERRTTRLFALVAAFTTACALSGCSLFVMAGKMVFGNPQAESIFKQSTKIDLVQDGKRMLIVCSTPDAVKTNFPSVDFDLLEGVTRRLKVRGVKVVDPDRVASWLDDHGGRWNDIAELAEKFHTDFVVHLDISKFTCQEDNSPTLLRGQSEGRVHVYRIADGPSGKLVSEVMDHEFTSIYPAGYPVSVEKKSSRLFTQEYLDRVCTMLAQIFYDHPVNEEIE